MNFTNSITPIKELLKNNIIAFGLVMSFAWIVSSSILASGISSVNSHNAISVTGTAEKLVMSDAGKWTFAISKQASSESYGYVSKQMKEEQGIAIKYLMAQGLKDHEITVQPVTSSVICQSQSQTMYDGQGRQQCSGVFEYSLSQTILVEGDNVTNIKNLSLNAPNALASLGVQVRTVSVDFLYTKLAEIRTTLLEEASRNAKERAQAIAKSTGNRIGSVKDASQGVFQVTQKNSTDVSDYGSYDTSTIEKKITAIVRASFEVK
jgi:hypothetical protein